jgi:hypothetical protein
MRTTLKLIAILMWLLGTGSSAYSQKLTEMYIPIGKCPGLSGKYTLLGKIQAFDGQKKTLTVVCTDGSYTVKITDQTNIWLDRSKLKLTNQVGAFTDCQKGRSVEVKCVNNQRKDGTAEWIKVGVERGG